jgi:hypothetical protein
MAKDETEVLVNPVLTAVQLIPLLVERKTPPSVPAKRFVSLTAKEETEVLVNPVLTAVQLVPLFVERKTPLPVPAKRFVPLTAREVIKVFVNPVLMAVQLVPLSVERKTPLKPVPAKRFVPESVKHPTPLPKVPLVCTHWGYASVVRKIINRKKNRLLPALRDFALLNILFTSFNIFNLTLFPSPYQGEGLRERCFYLRRTIFFVSMKRPTLN